MKKIIFIVILSACLLCLLSACSKKSDMTTRFEMEKKLDEIERLKSQMSVKDRQLSDKDLNNLVKEYTNVAKMVSLPDKTADTLTERDELKKAWHLALSAYSRIGLLYMFSRDYDKAYEYFKIVAENPAATSIEKMASTFNMAKCRERSRKYIEASALYDSLAHLYISNVVPLNPNMDALDAPIKSAEMWLRAGDAAKYNEKLEQSRIYYNQFKGKFPETSFGNILLGKIVASYLRQEKYSQAIKVMKSTKYAGNSSGEQISPNLLMMIADIYMKNMKQYRKAENTYREFIKIYPEHDKIGAVHLGLGLSMYQQGKYAGARKVLRKIEKAPKTASNIAAEVYYVIALCYEKEGDWGKAIGQYNVILAAFPGSDKAFEAALYMANYYKNKGDKNLANNAFNEAELYIKRYTNPETNSPVHISRAMGYLVKCYTEKKEFVKAIESLEQVFGQYPQFPEGKLAPLRMADLYENVLNKPDKAAQWLKTFLKANPDDEKYEQIMAHIKELE